MSDEIKSRHHAFMKIGEGLTCIQLPGVDENKRREVALRIKSYVVYLAQGEPSVHEMRRLVPRCHKALDSFDKSRIVKSTEALSHKLHALSAQLHDTQTKLNSANARLANHIEGHP